MKLFIALLLVVGTAATAARGPKVSKGPLVTTDTTVKGVAVTAGPEIAKGTQSEKAEELNNAGKLLKGVTPEQIMKQVKAKADKKGPAVWAERRTKLRTQMTTTTKTDVTVKVEDNAINEKAYGLDKKAVMITKYPGPDVDFNKMSLSMQRKLADIQQITNQVTQYSSHFYPMIVKMVERVKLKQKDVAEKKSLKSSDTKETASVVAEQVIDERLLSEDRAQLEVLIQTYNDLIASTKLGDDTIKKLAPAQEKLNTVTMAALNKMYGDCFSPAKDWNAKITEDLKSIKADDILKCTNVEKKEAGPPAGFFTSFGSVQAASSDFQELSTTKTSITTMTESVKGAKIPTPGYEATLSGGDARFKSGEDPLITKIRGDIEMISKDQREVRGLDTIATMPVTTGLRGGTAFLEMKKTDKECTDRKDDATHIGDALWCKCNTDKVLITKKEDCENVGGKRNEHCEFTTAATKPNKNVCVPKKGKLPAGMPPSKTTDIETKSGKKGSIVIGKGTGGFDDPEKIKAGTSVAGSNKVADSLFTGTAKVGDKTAVAAGTSTNTVKKDVTTDFSNTPVNANTILTALEKAAPRKGDVTKELFAVGEALTGSETFDKKGERYVWDLITKKKAGKAAKPSEGDVSKIAATNARSTEVDTAVALMDKRLQWLKDSMKEMSKYYIWASAELKRGVTVQTVTDKKTYNEVLSKMQHDQQETALDSSKIMLKMMEAFSKVSSDIDTIERNMKNAKMVIMQFEGFLDTITGATVDATKQCTAMKEPLNKWKKTAESVPKDAKDPKVKAECDQIATNIGNVLADCEKNPTTKTETCVKTFKTSFFGADNKSGTKEQFLKQFREVFAVYQAILTAFRSASGQ